MREIKFRGKRKDCFGIKGEWVYTGKKFSLGDFWRTVEADAIHKKTIGQFTGLQDKNGKKIYEGDILKRVNWSKPKKVYFENCSFLAKTSNRGRRHILHPVVNFKNAIEVIGNIYENSSLLEKEIK